MAMTTTQYVDLLNDELPERTYNLKVGKKTTIVTKETFIQHMVTMYNLVYKNKHESIKLN